jgi:very-short-patch-repair endonuclease
MRTESSIRDVASRRRHLITRRELEAIGLSNGAITRRVAAGRLHRKYQGVYAVGRSDLPIEGELLAAALAIGEDAVLSHFAAAVLWGFWTKLPSSPIDVTVQRRVRSRKRIRVHVAPTPRSDVTRCRSVPVTTPARTIVDLADILRSDKALRRTVHEAESMRLVSPARLRAQLERSPSQRVAKLVATGRRPTRSELEDAVDELLTRNGLRPPQTNVIVAGFEVDFFYPEQGLVIEADGARYHDTAIRQGQDRNKQAILEGRGLRVLRLRWEDTRPESEARTVARVRHALG